MKNRIRLVMLALLIALTAGVLTACVTEGEVERESAGNGQQKTGKTDFDDPAYRNEEDGAEVKEVQRDEKDFIGSWSATSERAKYNFGNVDLTIKEDHTWAGNIIEDNYRGRWDYKGGVIEIKDSEGLIDYELFYASDGTLMFRDLEDPEFVYVLKPGIGR